MAGLCRCLNKGGGGSFRGGCSLRDRLLASSLGLLPVSSRNWSFCDRAVVSLWRVLDILRTMLMLHRNQLHDQHQQAGTQALYTRLGHRQPSVKCVGQWHRSLIDQYLQERRHQKGEFVAVSVGKDSAEDGAPAPSQACDALQRLPPGPGLGADEIHERRLLQRDGCVHGAGPREVDGNQHRRGYPLPQGHHQNEASNTNPFHADDGADPADLPGEAHGKDRSHCDDDRHEQEDALHLGRREAYVLLPEQGKELDRHAGAKGHDDAVGQDDEWHLLRSDSSRRADARTSRHHLSDAGLLLIARLLLPSVAVFRRALGPKQGQRGGIVHDAGITVKEVQGSAEQLDDHPTQEHHADLRQGPRVSIRAEGKDGEGGAQDPPNLVHHKSVRKPPAATARRQRISEKRGPRSFRHRIHDTPETCAACHRQEQGVPFIPAESAEHERALHGSGH
eukprot:scaffold184_cov316-Pinguiococcus_pyrenoidosus.AAC.61